jgi:hypothetical protein
MTQVLFEVVGNGQMYIEINRQPAGLATYGNGVILNLVNGNQLGIVCTPYVGSTFINLCDVPQTDCQTSPSYYLDILNDQGLPQKMVATFSNSPVYKWLCQNGICIQSANGTFNTQQECQAAGCQGVGTRKELVTNLTSNETLIRAVVVMTDGGSATYISKRQEGNNWVFLFDFDRSTIDYTQFGAGAGLAKFIAANWMSIAAVLVSLGIVTIVWLWRDAVTAVPEAQATISTNDSNSIAGILADTTLTPDQKTALIQEILQKSYGSDWQTTAFYAVIILAIAYLIGEYLKRSK